MENLTKILQTEDGYYVVFKGRSNKRSLSRHYYYNCINKGGKIKFFRNKEKAHKFQSSLIAQNLVQSIIHRIEKLEIELYDILY